jgi:undecaprenyl diphosphate synthase
MAARPDPDRIPRHVAAVMDGNGRWARQRGLKRTEGHAAGEDALFDTVEGAIDLGIGYFTVYAFSTENWRRPPDEVRYLMGFNKGILERHAEDLHERNVRIRFAGRRDWRVPRGVLRRMDWASELTEHNTRMTLTIAFNYGGRAEIVDAIRSIVAAGVQPDRIDERTVARHLYLPDIPDPDLMIRTSGEYRISNFLLWELASSMNE